MWEVRPSAPHTPDRRSEAKINIYPPPPRGGSKADKLKYSPLRISCQYDISSERGRASKFPRGKFASAPKSSWQPTTAVVASGGTIPEWQHHTAAVSLSRRAVYGMVKSQTPPNRRCCYGVSKSRQALPNLHNYLSSLDRLQQWWYTTA